MFVLLCTWQSHGLGVPQTSQAGALQFYEGMLRLCVLHLSLRPSCQHCWPFVQEGCSPADC